MPTIEQVETARKNTSRQWNETCPACGSTNYEELPTVNLWRKFHCRDCDCFFGVMSVPTVTNVFWVKHE